MPVALWEYVKGVNGTVLVLDFPAGSEYFLESQSAGSAPSYETP
ncbi:MAG TPA: hypothetical protein VFE24_16165 [Pirellulales bacterium]|nr:hypothetical protein [Pirellulales bacterium]